MSLFRYSITVKLLLLFLIVGLMSVLMIGSYSFYSAKRAIISRTVEQLISVRTIKKQQVEYLFEVKEKNLQNLVRSGIFPKKNFHGNSSDNFSTMRELCRAYGFGNLYLAGDTGIRFLTSEGGAVGSVLTNQIRKLKDSQKKKEEPVISDLFFVLPGDSTTALLMGLYLLSTDVNDHQMIVAEIPGEEINRIMLNDNSHSGLGRSGEAYLTGKDLLMRTPSRFSSNSVLSTRVKTKTSMDAINGSTGAAITDDYRGIKVFSAYEPLQIKDLKWVILAEIDYDEAMVPVESLRNDILLVSVVISLLILGFSQIITRMITQPIKRLKIAAARLGMGNYDNKVHITSKDEIGLLAEAFNKMSDQLRDERINRLKAVYDGQEMERKRISRELHDGLGQKLVGTKLRIENCTKNDLAGLQKTILDAKQRLHSIVDELRRISNDLSPASLNELGLETALKNLCNDISRISEMEVDFEFCLENLPDEQVSVHLFRISQEALQNIIKHSSATTVKVQLFESRQSLILMLEDNGKGFDQQNSFSGNGLPNMRERATLLGGTFSIESIPGEGTTIRIKIPLNEKRH